MKDWWARNQGSIVVMVAVLLGIVGLATMNGGQGSWRGPESIQRTEEAARFEMRQQYAGRPLPFGELAEGSYTVMHAETHILADGRVLAFALIARPSDGDVRFVSEVPPEYFWDGATFQKGETLR